VSEPFPSNTKSAEQEFKKKRKKSAEMGYLIWVAAVGLSGAFLKFMQSTQFILAIAAD